MLPRNPGSRTKWSGLRPGLFVLLLAALPAALALEVPTRIEIRVPIGTNNTAAPGIYVCTGTGGDLSCPAGLGTLTDDAFLERIDFGAASFDFSEGEIAPGLVSVITSGTGVNAEWGDDDDDSDGNDDPFAKSGNPNADQETEVPALRDPAIAEALGDTSIVEGIDGEGNDYTLRLDFQAAVFDDDPGPDGSPELLFLERGINSDTRIRLIFQDAIGAERFTNFLFVGRSDLVDAGMDIDTVEIGGGQSHGIIGIDLSDFTGGGFAPAVSPVIGAEFGSAGGGADYFGFMALSRKLQRDFGDAPDPSDGTGPGNYRTRQADGGPRHLLPIPPTIYLGTSLPDADPGDLESAGADADDNDGTADEDGVTLDGTPLSGQSLILDDSYSATATLNGPGYLNAWIDLNRDGDFDDTVGGQSEQVLIDSDQTAASAQRTVAVPLPIPAAAAPGDTVVRIRFCGDANDCDTPGGTATSGEVEDHLVTLVAVAGGGSCYASFIDGATAPMDSAVWSFDDTLLDGSGNGHAPQNSPSVGYTPADALGSGSAVALSGDGIRYSDGSFLNDAFEDMTVGFWIRPSNSSPGSDQILYDEGGTVNGVAIVLTSAGTIRFDVREGGTQATIADVPLRADGAWHHVALGYDSGVVSAYLDGRLRAEMDTGFGGLASHPSDGGFGQVFGGSAAASNPSTYSGDLDEAFTLREAVLPAAAIRDYVECVAPVNEDFGDAPDTGPGTGSGNYRTRLGSDGPSHLFGAGDPHLGALGPDRDDGTQQSAAADADDVAGTDDEDGATLGGTPVDDRTLFRRQDHDIDVLLNGGGYLNVWLDLNRDGDFDDTIGGISEQVADDADFSANTGTSSTVVTLTIPESAVVGDSYLRIRYCSASGMCDTPTGMAPDGEIEDYRVELAPLPAAALLTGAVFEDNGTGGGIAHDGLVNGLEAGLGGVEVALLFDADDNGACDGSETVLARDVTDGDGIYALRPARVDQNKPACLVVDTPPGFRSISEDAGGTAVVMGGSFDDFATLVTPEPGDVLEDLNFGDIRLPRLAPDRQDSVQPGGSVSYLHFYDSTTDATVDFALGGISENPADIGWSDVLYRDPDCDGELTGNEASQPLTAVAVQAGQQLCLLVRTFGPASAPADALHARDVQAASTFTGTGEGSTSSVTDITTVTASQLRLRKSVRDIGPDGIADTADDGDLQPETFNDAAPGDVLRYRIHFRNEGSLPLDDLRITDATPDFTALEAPLACPGTLPPALSACAVTTPDGVNALGYQGSLRWIFTGILQPGAEGTVTFDVRIDE